MIIPLRDALLRRFSNLPAGFGFLRAFALRTLRLGASGRYASAAWRVAAESLPIWSCSVWGLPCRACYQSRGALLPHLFTLTPPRLRSVRRYVFCCTGRPDALKHPSRTLSGTLPCGVRTFLPRSTACAASGSDHPAACRFKCSAASGWRKNVEGRMPLPPGNRNLKLAQPPSGLRCVPPQEELPFLGPGNVFVRSRWRPDGTAGISVTTSYREDEICALRRNQNRYSGVRGRASGGRHGDDETAGREDSADESANGVCAGFSVAEA